MQRLSNFRNRVANLGNDLGPVGTSIMNPDIQYHQLAYLQSLPPPKSVSDIPLLNGMRSQ